MVLIKRLFISLADITGPDDLASILDGHLQLTLYRIGIRLDYNRKCRSRLQLHSILQGHPDAKKVPGVDASTGSLGQGVSIAVGMALGAKHLGKDTKVFALVGDGESQEGQIWEAYMAAAHYKLDNLTVIIDNNGLQIDGTNDQVMSLGDLPAKLRAFGFDLIELPDGNDLDAVEAALSKPTMPGKPKAILAHTVKGKGVSFMENQVGWHGKAPNAEQREQALKELED